MYTITFDSLAEAFQREVETDRTGISATDVQFCSMRLIAMAIAMCAMALKEGDDGG